jgi:hypothetical protein
VRDEERNWSLDEEACCEFAGLCVKNNWRGCELNWVSVVNWWLELMACCRDGWNDYGEVRPWVLK